MIADVKTSVEVEVEKLVEMRRQPLGDGYGFHDYELRLIRGEARDEGGEAAHVLMFTPENLGAQYAEAVSCDVCGALFIERLSAMRRHRLKCGWEQ